MTKGSYCEGKGGFIAKSSGTVWCMVYTCSNKENGGSDHMVVTMAECLRDYRKKSEIVEDSVSCTLKYGQGKGEIYGTWGI